MTTEEILHISKRVADTNLQLIEIIADLSNSDKIHISEELAEMLNFCLDINFQLYRLTTEKLKENADIL